MTSAHAVRSVFALALSIVTLLAPALARADPQHPERRGLLASAPFAGQAVRGVYFFPGEGGDTTFYTAHPALPDDVHWNSVVASRAKVVARMAAAHVNTVVMSDWSIMPQFSPMIADDASRRGLIETAAAQGLLVLPALESGSDPNQAVPQWNFEAQFPQTTSGLLARLREVVALFGGHQASWAQLYDRDGVPRFAVQILHACSDRDGVSDQSFADAFGAVARQAESELHVRIGFLLDAIGGCHYSPGPKSAGPVLAREPAVLGIAGYASEVFSNKVKNGPRCAAADVHQCHPHDNNADNLPPLADWKRAALADWVGSGLPVLLDVTNGFDGRFVWGKQPGGTGFWGDNFGATDDRWRNWMSELKGQGAMGIVVDTWNGYTEGYAAVPTLEHGMTVTAWLADLLEPDPRQCSHMHYVGGQRTVRVFGAISVKWIQLGADRGFGAPSSPELSEGAGRVSRFANGASIYWSGPTGAHEVHGLIAESYLRLRGAASCLGLPISDEEASGSGRVSRFEHGRIDWRPGDVRASPICQIRQP